MSHFKFTYAEFWLPFGCLVQFHKVLLHFFSYAVFTIPDSLLLFGSFSAVTHLIFQVTYKFFKQCRSQCRILQSCTGNSPGVILVTSLFIFFANLSKWGLYGSSWILWVIPLSFYTGLAASDFHLDKCYENKLADLEKEKSCSNTHTLVSVSSVGSLTWLELH